MKFSIDFKLCKYARYKQKCDDIQTVKLSTICFFIIKIDYDMDLGNENN